MSKTAGIRRLRCDAECGQPMFEQFLWDDAETPACPICGGKTHRVFNSGNNAEAPDLYSEAVGVHPSQIKEAQAKFPHHRFAPDGRMIFSSQREKDRVLKDLGYVDHRD